MVILDPMGIKIMNNTDVFLIGGAPGVGKTTLACTLASRLGISSVTIDDLMTVAQTVTTPDTHPNLHVMSKIPYYEYFTDSSVEQLKADADIQHEATWPFVKRVIVKHSTWAVVTIMIDGWHLRPDRVAQLDLDNVWSGWIVASSEVLEERERNNLEWLQRSSDPSLMLKKFLARSLWYNDLIKEQATKQQMNILFQEGDTSVDDLCKIAFETMKS